MATFTVSIEISVDAEPGTPLREIARKGWDDIVVLEAPIVQVVDDATGATHVVDFEEGDADEAEEAEEVRQARAFYAEHGYMEGMEPASDLPSGYRWADAEETERIETISGALLVARTADSTGTPYTEGEADWAVPE